MDDCQVENIPWFQSIFEATTCLRTTDGHKGLLSRGGDTGFHSVLGVAKKNQHYDREGVSPGVGIPFALGFYQDLSLGLGH